MLATLLSDSCSLVTWDRGLPFLLGQLIAPLPPPPISGTCNKSRDVAAFVWVYWNCAFNQNDPVVFVSPRWEPGCWGSSLPTEWLVPPHSAGHNLHIHNSKRQLSFSTQILIYHHRYKHLPDFLFAFWCFWSIKCLCGWIVFFPSSLLYVSDGFIPWDQLLFTHPFIYPGF